MGTLFKHALAATALILFLACRDAAPFGQELKLQDLPATGIGAPGVEGTSLKAPLRASVEEALQARDYPRAETLLVDEVKKNPQSPDILKLLGGIFFLDGRYLNSAVAYKKAEAITPLDDRSRFTLVLAYIVLNHRDWARPELVKLRKLDPKNPLYPYWLGRLDYDAMHYTAALVHFKKALELDPGYSRAYDNMGLCHEALGKYDEAIEDYQQAVRLNRQKQPNSPWPPLNLGALLVKLGRQAEAEEYLRESLGYNPKFPQVRYQLGLLLEKQGKDAEALQELDQAALLDPAYPEPHYVLGQIYRKKGEMKKAEMEWTKFQQLKKAKPNERPH